MLLNGRIKRLFGDAFMTRRGLVIFLSRAWAKTGPAASVIAGANLPQGLDQAMNRAERRKIEKTNGQGHAESSRAASARALRDRAISRHRAGSPAEAVELFNRSLEQNDGDSFTHHGLGLALRDLGQPDAGLRHLGQALALTPEDPVLLNNIGSIHFASGRFLAARQAFEAALIFRQDWPLLWRGLGGALLELGMLDEAASVLTRALAMDPNDSWAHYFVGRVAVAKANGKAAATAYERALLLNPSNRDLALQLAEVTGQIGERERSNAALRHALALKPDDVPTIIKVARGLTNMGKHDEALILLDHARSLEPGDPTCALALAWAHRGRGDTAAAEALCEEVIAAHPEVTDSLFYYGFLRMEAGDTETALHWFNRALEQQPDHIDSATNNAYISLAKGDFAHGWKHYESRLRIPAYRFNHHEGRRWSGEPLQSKTILIEAEQGFGDTLQFIRYVPLVAAQAERVLLRVPPMLAGLLGSFPANVILAPWETKDCRFDYRIELMSLPLLFGTTIDTIPLDIPYLAVDQARLEAWSERLADGSGAFRVGVVWAGNPDHLNDCNRSMPARALEPLSTIPGVRLYSLQVGPRASDIVQLPEGAVTDLSPLLTDYAETGAALASLDLLIAVDTSVIHLAGALGRPTWLLLASVSEWRWMRDRDDTPWYPGMKLFRQSAYRDWPELIGRVASALEAAASAHRQLS